MDQLHPPNLKGFHSAWCEFGTKVKKKSGSILKCDMFMTPTFCQVPYAQCKVDIVLLLCNLTSSRAELVESLGRISAGDFFFAGEKNRDPLNWLSDLQIGNQKVTSWITCDLCIAKCHLKNCVFHCFGLLAWVERQRHEVQNWQAPYI